MKANDIRRHGMQLLFSSLHSYVRVADAGPRQFIGWKRPLDIMGFWL